jgi:integrase
MGKLTATAVRALIRTPGTKHGDGDGLWLHVRKVGQAAWYLHYGTRRRERAMSLGSVEHVSLADAREKAGALRKLIASGIDPLAQRDQAKAEAAVAQQRATTFAEACDAYLDAHGASWRNPKHRWQWRATLDLACNTIGERAVSTIETDDVLRVLQPIWHTKPETASRLRGRIEKVLSYATTRAWRDRNVLNPATWRGNLEHNLPSRHKVRAVRHHAALPWKEAPAFMQALGQREGFGASALSFAILTATRSGEVRSARWEEIDLDAAVWTIPAARMKAGKEHRVPLSKPALAILRQMADLKDGGGLVFLGQKRGVSLSDMTLTAVLRRMGHGDLTAHGFRSTFRDWAAEATAHPNHVVEQALAHAIGNAVEAAYRRGDLFGKRITLMDEWAAYLAQSSRHSVAPPVP